MTINHPRKDDQGRAVEIKHPNQPTSQESWSMSDQLATVIPDSLMPATVSGLPIASWRTAPTKAAGWKQLVEDSKFEEPPMLKVAGKEPASGAVVIEPDGRVWVVSPSNGHGGYTNTFPKGKLDAKEGLSLRQNALKEVYEEAGLQVALTGFLCDSVRDTTVTRFYLARRISGNPADMSWESQSVHLVPMKELAKFATHSNDQSVIGALSQNVAADSRTRTLQSGFSEETHSLLAKIRTAKEKISSVFPSIECEEIKRGFNTVLVYALLELASEAGKDDGWFQEAFNETMWGRHQAKS